MFALFILFIAVSANEYILFEYNKGVYEIYEFDKCYCFAEDGCYSYIRIDGSDAPINEKYYEGATNCDGENPTVTPYNIGDAGSNLKISMITELPEHDFQYHTSMDDQCTEESYQGPVCMMTNDNCERDYYTDDENAIYRTYRIEGEKVKIAQFSDNQCTVVKPEQSAMKFDQCEQIEGEGAYGKFINEPYTLPEEIEYLLLEYNKGVYEIYEFDKCYCFAEDGCYSYTKVDGSDAPINEKYYEGATNCDGEHPTIKPYNIGEAQSDLKVTLITELPEHAFQYHTSMDNTCSQESYKGPVCIMTNDNCESDYEIKGLYRTYRIKDGKVEITQYSDNQCTTVIPIESEMDLNQCQKIEGEGAYGKFINEKYTLPEETSGTISYFLLLAILLVIFI